MKNIRFTIVLVGASLLFSSCSEESTSRYLVKGEKGEIIEDTTTGLQWQRCSVGQTWSGNVCAGEAASLSWIDAIDQGVDGWRVPTDAELRTLVFCTNTEKYDSNGDNNVCGPSGLYMSPTINAFAFPNSPPEWYWSSTPFTDINNLAWMVSFQFGGVSYSFRDRTEKVRLVRTVQE